MNSEIKNPIKILLVEDNNFDRAIFSRALKRDDKVRYDVRELACGRDLAQVALQWQPAMVILDNKLPGASGLDLIRSLIVRHGKIPFPVVLTTGCGNEAIAVEALQLGVIDYIIKDPLMPSRICQIVARAVEKSVLQKNLIDQLAVVRQSQRRLEVALQATGIGIWEWVPGAETLRCTPEAERIMGFASGKELLTMADFLSRLDVQDRAEMLGKLMAAVSSRRSFHHEFRIHYEDGTEHWVVSEGTMDMTEDAIGRRFIGTVLDITSRKKVDIELARTKQNAELANQAKTVFLANMSHELRTPLGAVIGFAELALDEQSSEAEHKDALTTIWRNAKLLSCLVDEVLDLSKIEAGHIEIESTALNLPELVRETLSGLALKAQVKGIALKVEIAAEVPTCVLTDATRLKQCLLNVVGNAIKFTAAGEVVVAVTASTDDEQGATLRVAVTDSGVGLSPEQSHRIFQPFAQADSSTTRQFGGTGLGLALSKTLARALGGDLVLESSVLGSGSTFVLTVQVQAAEADINSSGVLTDRFVPLRSLDSLTGLRLLFADDSLDNRRLIGRFLEMAGATVDFAFDGYEAVSKATAQPYDAILMDIQMPHMDGYEAARILHDRGVLVPIIALTAHAMRSERDLAMRHGFVDFLSKPVQREALLQSVHRVAEMQHRSSTG